MTSPIVQANRFGLVETHCGCWRRVIQRDTAPAGAVFEPDRQADQELEREHDGDDSDRNEHLLEVGIHECHRPGDHREARCHPDLVLVENGRPHLPTVIGQAKDDLPDSQVQHERSPFGSIACKEPRRRWPGPAARRSPLHDVDRAAPALAGFPDTSAQAPSARPLRCSNDRAFFVPTGKLRRGHAGPRCRRCPRRHRVPG